MTFYVLFELLHTFSRTLLSFSLITYKSLAKTMECTPKRVTKVTFTEK